MTSAMVLAGNGWWGGNPEKVLQAPADLVLAAIEYSAFKSDFEAEYIRLNRESK